MLAKIFDSPTTGLVLGYDGRATGEQEELVLRVAHQSGKTPEEVIVYAVTNMDDVAEAKLIEERIADADSDSAQWLSHEEVVKVLRIRNGARTAEDSTTPAR